VSGRWCNDPEWPGVVWVDGAVDPIPLARQRILNGLAQLETHGHALNRGGIRLCRRVIAAECRTLMRAGLTTEARLLLRGRTVLARLGPTP
jgi:hypothetical protein